MSVVACWVALAFYGACTCVCDERDGRAPSRLLWLLTGAALGMGLSEALR